MAENPPINYSKAPLGCELWTQETPNLNLENVKVYTNEFPVYADEAIRKLMRCADCGQLYFYEMLEYIDWEEGNDPTYRTYIPVASVADADKLAFVPQLEIIEQKPQIRKDWPKEAPEPVIAWVK
jgi:hypothetical protein